MKTVMFCFLLIFNISIASAQSLLDVAESLLFDAESAPRIGLEIELTGLTQDQIAIELQKTLGGEIIEVEKVESNLDSRSHQVVTYTIHELHLINSSMGRPVIVKPEDNVTENIDMAEAKARTRIYEIVTPPIYFVQAIPLQQALENMRAMGAEGTSEGHAVAIQVNVEMGEGDPEKISSLKVLAILRNYLRPGHRESIATDLNVPGMRQSYLGMFTPGMMSRILDVEYQPTNEQFFFDFMYRQSLELFGRREAWTMPESDVRLALQQFLEAPENFNAILPVVKFNFIRVSAVLMFLFPDDWLSRFLTASPWFHNYPILEFREANSDFQLLKHVKQFLGIVQYSEKYGDIPWSPENSSSLQCSSLF